MWESNGQQAFAKRKRRRALKNLIILSLCILFLVQLVLWMRLSARVNTLNEQLAEANRRLDTMASAVSSGEEQLRGFLEMQEAGKDGQSQAQPEPGQELMQEPELGSRFPGEEALNEDEKAFEETAAHKVYLTFDDGPSSYTREILDILDRYEVKATFFVVGKEDAESMETLAMIADRGHSLGMHSYSHKYEELYESEESFAEDFGRIQDYIYEAAGVKSNLYRFPGGSSNQVSSVPMEEFAKYLESQGVRFFDWNVSSGDGGRNQLTAETLIENCIQGIEDRGTSVILLHDSAQKSTTVEALPAMIEKILAMEDTAILPITEETALVQHISIK